MARLVREVVERQIVDMWDAVLSAPQDEGYSKACDEAKRVEAELRAKLKRQQKLDLHSQDLRDALRLILDHGTRMVDGEDENPIGVHIEGCEVRSKRFHDAWLAAVVLLEEVDRT